jgi:hypothetical protein
MEQDKEQIERKMREQEEKISRLSELVLVSSRVEKPIKKAKFTRNERRETWCPGTKF